MRIRQANLAVSRRVAVFTAAAHLFRVTQAHAAHSPRIASAMARDRRLFISYRSVPEAHRAAYDDAWDVVREKAEERGVHAWRFVHPDSPGLFVEFVEFGAGDDPRGEGPLGDALRALDADFDADPGDVRARSAWAAA